MPMHHYWPIKDDDDMCKSIKFAVEWGTTHKQKVLNFMISNNLVLNNNIYRLLEKIYRHNNVID